MKVGIFGTGIVGRTLGTKFVEVGHSVTMGSREVGSEKARDWAEETGGEAFTGSHLDAGVFGELLVNATAGRGSLEVLQTVGAENLNNKILLDIANPLDFSAGTPPTFSVSNTDSLGEQIQRTFPEMRVVKVFNTIAAELMTHPDLITGGHNTFIAGNDASARVQTLEILLSFGWTAAQVIDFGGISASRALEGFAQFWYLLYESQQTELFNMQILKA